MALIIGTAEPVSVVIIIFNLGIELIDFKGLSTAMRGRGRGGGRLKPEDVRLFA